MTQASIWKDGRLWGCLTAQQQGLYTVFRGRGRGHDLCRAYAIFEGGELALGIPVPEGEDMLLRASLPTSRLPQGRLLRGELRPKDDPWQSFPGGQVGQAELPSGQVRGGCYRFPWSPEEKLPYGPYLCFFRYVREREKSYLELSLDENGLPCRDFGGAAGK